MDSAPGPRAESSAGFVGEAGSGCGCAGLMSQEGCEHRHCGRLALDDGEGCRLRWHLGA